MNEYLTDAERDALAEAFEHGVEASCWNPECEAGVLYNIKPIIARHRANAWDECCEGFVWALANGPDDMAIQYVRDHNPYRNEP